jgi:hypothetical protein
MTSAVGRRSENRGAKAAFVEIDSVRRVFEAHMPLQVRLDIRAVITSCTTEHFIDSIGSILLYQDR